MKSNSMAINEATGLKLCESLEIFVRTETQAPHSTNIAFYSGFQIIRYYQFLLLIEQRYTEASQRFHTAQERLVMLSDSSSSNSREPIATEGQLFHEYQLIALQIQLDIESFYLFAKIMLDKTAQFIQQFFGKIRGCEVRSHDNWSKRLRMYCQTKNLIVDDSFVEAVEQMRIVISDFRDKQIQHEESPRTIRGLGLIRPGQDRGLSLTLGRIFPKDGDVDIRSYDIPTLSASIDTYLKALMRFVERNRQQPQPSKTT